MHGSSNKLTPVSAFEISLVNKGQNMFHKFSLEANCMAIYYWQEIDFHLVSENCQTTCTRD